MLQAALESGGNLLPEPALEEARQACEETIRHRIRQCPESADGDGTTQRINFYNATASSGVTKQR